ncbi:trypsin-like serine peptidase [Streptomyces sp. NPDC059650]|uniref:trypsin-like serine peptidase n=1 Tax=Streptomyces sp. NPDC059650 TaxID=3346896 RepID=UPI00368CFFB5
MANDPHTPVSNQPEELATAVPEQPVFEGPSEGVQGSATPFTSDGLEQVNGHSRSVLESVPPETWRAPAAVLPDIGVASFGPPEMLETVHGPDDRVQIADTSNYPWRAHASLLITAADNSQWIGTGWFIGPHTLATAGHVVFIKNSGVPGRDGWVKSIQVMPGRNGSTLPFGAVTSTSFRTVTGWTDSGDENFDYGAVIIPTELGATTGWFGFGAWPDADLLKTSVNISGYPGDKPPGTQWYDGRGVSSVNPLKVFYDIDTAGGQSGSAVYRIHNGGRYGIAVHAYGGVTTNSGTRITRSVFNNLVQWKA